MRYSLINGDRIEAQPHLSGQCQTCGHPTITKCGEVKIWHWAHRGKRMCDMWWENETEWHRNWKNCFPVDWQEVIQQDKNDEKHIADVKTTQGWVLEFQHSFLNPEERRARNAFYEKLVWVVDGTRRIRDKKQFLKSLNELNELNYGSELLEVRTVNNSFNDCALLTEWSGIQAHVFFDFGEEVLWFLLPIGQDIRGGRYVVSFPRRRFIEIHNNGTGLTNQNFEDCLKELYDLVNPLIESAAQSRSAMLAQMGFQQRLVPVVRPRRHFRF